MRPNLPILLVDDDQVDVMTIKRAFRDLGISNPVTHVSNGEEALQFLRSDKRFWPGLIFLDINMPVMNGVEFLREIKQDDRLSSIPIVILTTSNNEKDKFESFRWGIAGYMLKPVDYGRFIEVIRSIDAYWSNSERAIHQ